MTYLNNAATSFPKPPEVVEAVNRALESPPVEPGRSGGREDPAARCRTILASLLGASKADHIALLPSATHALNTVVSGLLQPGDHVVTTILEHNSVLRPLAHAARRLGVTITELEPDQEGMVTADAVAAALQDRTALVVLTQASNVTGSIQPVEEVARAVAGSRASLLIDASQSAGAVPLRHRDLPGRVFIAFAGHKGLMGPTGIGGLVVPDESLGQTIVGGTGIRSESEFHPGELPLRHEAGTPNLLGLAGLEAGARFVLDRGVEAMGAHRHGLVALLREGIRAMKGLWLAPLAGEDGRAGVVSLTMEGWRPEELVFLLRESFGIESRGGLHCAPGAHVWLRTAPLGTVRLSVGIFNTDRDIEAVLSALAQIGQA